MQYVKLGQTGVDVSRICLGMMSFGKAGTEHGLFPWAKSFEQAKPIFQRAIELGINFFDTANVYQTGSSEIITGQLLREFALNRDEIVVATKAHFPMRGDRPNSGGSSRKNLLAEIDHSLQRLQLDYVDVFQIHRLDHGVPMEEIMETLHDIVKSGKARYIGASSMRAWEFERMQNIAERHGWTKFIAMQNHYSLIQREEEREMLPLCADRKVAVIPWSPLAGGRLARPWAMQTDRTQIDQVSPLVWTAQSAENDQQIVQQVEQIAKNRGVSMAEVALAWLLSKSMVTSPIVGTTSVQHVEQAVSALDLTLSTEEIQSLEQLYQPHADISALF